MLTFQIKGVDNLTNKRGSNYSLASLSNGQSSGFKVNKLQKDSSLEIKNRNFIPTYNTINQLQEQVEKNENILSELTKFENLNEVIE